MIGVIIQARMNSKRLTGKVLLKLASKPVLWHVVERCRQASFPRTVVVATTTNSEDRAIELLCKEAGVLCFRGNDKDVLERYLTCAELFNLTTIVRVTADCPLIDPSNMDQTIAMHIRKGADYSTNRLIPTFPHGFDVDVFTLACLKKVHERATSEFDREHIVTYIWKHPNEFKISDHRSPVDLSDYRWVLDYPEDYELLTNIYSSLYVRDKTISTNDVLELLKANPAWNRTNVQYSRYEGYAQSINSMHKKDG